MKGEDQLRWRGGEWGPVGMMSFSIPHYLPLPPHYLIWSSSLSTPSPVSPLCLVIACIHLCHHAPSQLHSPTYLIWSSPTTSPFHLVLTLYHTILTDSRPSWLDLLTTPSPNHFQHLISSPSITTQFQLVLTFHHTTPIGPHPPPHHPNRSSPSTTPSQPVLTLHHTIPTSPHPPPHHPNWSSPSTTPYNGKVHGEGGIVGNSKTMRTQ